MVKKMTKTSQLPQHKLLGNLDIKNIHYLTKWMILDKPEKLETIKRSQLYAGYPEGFNDVFDSQIKIGNTEKRKISQSVANKDVQLNVLEDLRGSQKKDFNRDSYYLDELSILIEQTHGANIACFSELNPLLLESNHMWGVYGSCGYGIALKYKIGRLKQWIATNKYYNSSFYEVVYSNQEIINNKLKWLESILEILVLDKSDKKIERAVNSRMALLTYKSQEWQFEKEWRFLNLSEVFTPKDNENTVNYIQRIEQYRQNKHNCLFDFIKPDEIIFGWNNHKNQNWEAYAYTELEKWAKDNHVKCVYLDDKLNYAENKFKTRPKRLPE
ncbi:MAG: DUF2971 domain-containing protein [Neisseriaceae bacterium]|nr:MAG: DUF2971 domain-containing protein [Neisseriaceae bacterium]